MTKISNFARFFWANRGNHNDTTAQKFLPEFTFEELKEAIPAHQERRPIGILMAQASHRYRGRLDSELTDLHQSLFDAYFEPMVTAKSPKDGMDILQASANNFYSASAWPI